MQKLLFRAFTSFILISSSLSYAGSTAIPTQNEKELIAAGLASIALSASICGWDQKTKQKALALINGAEAELKAPDAPFTYTEFETLIESIGPKIESSMKADPAVKRKICKTSKDSLN